MRSSLSTLNSAKLSFYLRLARIRASKNDLFHIFSVSKSDALAAEVLSLKSDVSKYTLARTESLISDVLSFYSLDGTETKDDASKILSSSESHSMKTAPISIGSPTSTQYETASSAASLYETASAGPYSAASGAATRASLDPPATSIPHLTSAPATAVAPATAKQLAAEVNIPRPRAGLC